MSFEPPKTNQPGTIPGYIVVLAAFSVLTLLFSIGIGLVAFGVVDVPWAEDDDPPPATVAVGDTAMQMSGFTILEEREVDGRPEFTVNVSVTNTGDEPLSNVTVFVQCLDGGNVSNSQLLLGVEPDQTLQLEMILYGTGSPTCTEPQVSFDE